MVRTRCLDSDGDLGEKKKAAASEANNQNAKELIKALQSEKNEHMREDHGFDGTCTTIVPRQLLLEATAPPGVTMDMPLHQFAPTKELQLSVEKKKATSEANNQNRNELAEALQSEKNACVHENACDGTGAIIELGPLLLEATDTPEVTMDLPLRQFATAKELQLLRQMQETWRLRWECSTKGISADPTLGMIIEKANIPSKTQWRKEKKAVREDLGLEVLRRNRGATRRPNWPDTDSN